MSQKLDRFTLNTPANRVKERFHGDLMFKETVFVYPVTITKGGMGGQTKSWATVPIPVRASVQVEALNGQQTAPDEAPNRIAHIFIRQKNGFKWHDKVRWRNITMQIEYVEERIENESGQFQFLYGRALFLTEKDSINGTPATFEGL